MFKKNIIIRNVATISLMGYMVYWFFPIPPILWRLVWVLLSLYAIGSNYKRLLPVEKYILLFCLFNLVHFFLSFLWSTPHTAFIGNTLSSLLVLSLFTWLANKEVLSDKYFSIASAFFIVCAILGYLHYRTTMLNTLGKDMDYDITNNSSAPFLMLLPMLFLLKNNVQKWASLMICVFYLVMSAKRGNILAAVLPVILFVFFNLKNERRSGLKSLIVVALFIASSFLVYRWVIANDYLIHRIEQTAEGDSSGRDIIYAAAWYAWYNADSILNVVFGYGYGGNRVIGSSAHSDWLEILVDYGMIGVILYLFIFIALYRQIIWTKNSLIKNIILSSTLIWFFKSVYSMGFMSPYMPILMISLGSALGFYKNEK